MVEASTRPTAATDSTGSRATDGARETAGPADGLALLPDDHVAPPRPAPPAAEALAHAGDVAAFAEPRTARRWRVTALATADDGLRLAESMQAGAPTVFQSAAWLRDWCATLGHAGALQPLWLVATNRFDGEPEILWPLVVRRRGAVREAIAMDGGITDYNAPLLRPGLRLDAAEAGAWWQALRIGLAAHADVLRVDKLLLPAPLLESSLPAAAPQARASGSRGHRFSIEAGWELWRQSLGRQVRREAERHQRVFERWPGARFESVTDLERACAVFERLEALQRQRMQRPGTEYRLDDPACSAFYRRRLRHGLGDGSVRLTCLRVGDEIIAALYGLSDGQRFTVVRFAFGGEVYKPCAPGRLLLERTVRLLYDEGCRSFDLGVGDYPHKRAFGCTPVPLVDTCEALTLRGLPTALAWRARHALRAHPAPRRLAQGWRRVRQALRR